LRLGQVIKNLKTRNPDEVLSPAFGGAASSRGLYEELAFEPKESSTVREMLAVAEDALGSTFTGYKGGEYVMDADTRCCIARWGECSHDDEDYDALVRVLS
jgi:hypothetical protein